MNRNICYSKAGVMTHKPQPHNFSKLNEKTIFCNRCGLMINDK